MSDVLSPAEQVRAAQWAANWLGDHGYDSHRLSGGDAVAALRWAVDELDPPETVERCGESRNLQAELAAALRDNERFEGEQEELVQALDKLSAANDTIVRLRATHTQAEAAWGRCARED